LATHRLVVVCLLEFLSLEVLVLDSFALLLEGVEMRGRYRCRGIVKVADDHGGVVADDDAVGKGRALGGRVVCDGVFVEEFVILHEVRKEPVLWDIRKVYPGHGGRFLRV